MKGYRDIALHDLEEAQFNFTNRRFQSAVFFYQQFAEKSAKALLEKKDPEHKLLKSHVIEKILEAYDEEHKTSEIGDKARYLTGFYFDTRYPGDNYSEITEAQAKKAKALSDDLEKYFKAEMKTLTNVVNSMELDIKTSPMLKETYS